MGIDSAGGERPGTAVSRAISAGDQGQIRLRCHADNRDSVTNTGCPQEQQYTAKRTDHQHV
jgi:hypothetical protein